MSTQQAALSRGRANLLLTTLFFGVFVLGYAELLVVGALGTDPAASTSAWRRPVPRSAHGWSAGTCWSC